MGINTSARKARRFLCPRTPISGQTQSSEAFEMKASPRFSSGIQLSTWPVLLRILLIPIVSWESHFARFHKVFISSWVKGCCDAKDTKDL